jgi:hypothetical protein
VWDPASHFPTREFAHVSSRIASFLVALVLLLPVAAFAQSRDSGAVVNVMIAAVALQNSGMEIEAAATGNGIFIFYITSDDSPGNSQYVYTIDDASVFDISVAEITPTFKFGPNALTSTIREGRVEVGGTIGRAPQFPRGRLPWIMSQHPVFVPAGKFFSARRRTVNTAFDATVGFYEAQR